MDRVVILRGGTLNYERGKPLLLDLVPADWQRSFREGVIVDIGTVRFKVLKATKRAESGLVRQLEVSPV